jgi:hypothetical protein
MALLCLNVTRPQFQVWLKRFLCFRGIRNHCLFPYVVVLSQGRSVI